MTWYSAYVDSKQDVIDFIGQQRPDLTTDDITDTDLKMADTLVFSYLYKSGRIKVTYDGTSEDSTPSVSDELNLLWLATICYLCELLSYRGIIHYNVGGIQKTKVGSTITEFMNMQPMFFMGSNPGGLDPVRPFRSFKQLGQELITTFISLYNKDEKIDGFAPSLVWDSSSRGYGWNANIDDYIGVADSELTGDSA